MPFQWVNLESEEHLNQLFAECRETASALLLLKHSTRCAFSSMAKSRLEREPSQNVKYVILDILKNRDLSRIIEERWKVKHESPQSFLFFKDKLMDVKSHMAISASDLNNKAGELV
ncbi:MAG: bacillithiol system redox-active protein YtxJ [Bacteroidetes bacterium]|jgi:bacillithiol system protein YtxJ|nr:bacillithiol system redox-active protein YtxJ [Bacteroidota bacterium]